MHTRLLAGLLLALSFVSTNLSFALPEAPPTFTNQFIPAEHPTIVRAATARLLDLSEERAATLGNVCDKDPYGEQECGKTLPDCVDPMDPERHLRLVLWPNAFTIYQTVSTNLSGPLSTGNIAFVDSARTGLAETVFVVRPMSSEELDRQVRAEARELQERYVENTTILIGCLERAK